jgi:hypothetical protein
MSEQKKLLNELLKYKNLDIVISFENNKIVKRIIDVKRSIEEGKIKYKKVGSNE